MTQNFKGIVRLSNENYLTLSTTGTLTLKDGSILTFDPTSTLYITPDSTIDFTQEDKDKVEVIDISGDGTQFLSNDGSYKTIESGIETLIGTEDRPINFATDIEMGKLYLISGYYKWTRLGTRSIGNGVYLAQKTDTNNAVIIYNRTQGSTNMSPGSGYLLHFNSEGVITSEEWAQGIKLNNSLGSSSPVRIYAPTKGGTAGQVLQSNGNTEPTWMDLPESGIPTLIGTEEKPINLATDLKVGNAYLLNGYVLGDDRGYNVNLGGEDSEPTLFIKLTDTILFADCYYKPGNTAYTSYQTYFKIDATTGLYKSLIRKKSSIGDLNSNLTGSPVNIWAPTTGGTTGQILQSNGSRAPTWIDLPDALPQLNGTEDIPINLYNDLEVNKLYSISGVIYNSDNNLTANDSILTYKTNTNSLYLIGGKIDLLTSELTFQPNYFTVAEVEATGEISTHQSSIAPVNSGASGQVLTSNGPDQEPTWEDISTPNNPNTSALTANGAELNFNAGDSTGTAHLVCNQNLYIGEETKDLSLDCDTFQLFTQDGWNWESTITDENGDDDTARFSFQMGNITLSNSNQGVHLNKATDQIILQASSVRGNTSTADLGTSDLPWNNIYGKTIYQNGQQVATKAEAALYKHNVSINGSNDSGQQINARVVGLNRSNVLVTTYGQLINMITGAVDYPLSGYVYNEDSTFLGTILYFDYNMGNYFEFTVATSTGIEVIQLTTAQATISDTVAVVE